MKTKTFIHGIIKSFLLLAAGFVFFGCAGASSGGEGGEEIVIINGSWTTSIDTVGSVSGSSDPHVFFYAARKANVVWNVAVDGYVVYSNAFTGSGWVGQQSRTDLYNGTPPTAPRIFSNGHNVSFAVWRGGSS